MPKPRKYDYPVGSVVGQLTVTGHRMVPRPDGRNRRLLEVQCSCGSAPKLIMPYNLGSGTTTSCGCAQRANASSANIKHGAKSKSATSDQKRLLSIWKGMNYRCNTPTAKNYKWYGGKGVVIEWDDFDSFYSWAMDNGYTSGLTLDRIDVSGNYSPTNCWWVTDADNRLRSGLYIDKELDAASVVYAQAHNLSYNALIEQALQSFLGAGSEVNG